MTDRDEIAELAATLTDPLRRNGGIRVLVDSDDERDLYRRAGRKAGRLLARPVRTMVSGNDVLIWLDDWGTNPLERQLMHARVRNAMQRTQP